MVYLYSMQAIALLWFCIALHLEVSRWLCRKLIAVSMLGVFVDMSYTSGPSKPSPAPSPSWFSGNAERLAKAPNSHIATQPQI
jgi:hypothetical protein